MSLAVSIVPVLFIQPFHVCCCKVFYFPFAFCNKLSGSWILLPIPPKYWYYRDTPQTWTYTYFMKFSYLEKPEGVTRIMLL